jgi:hypothetical protein
MLRKIIITGAGTAYPSGAHEFTPVFSGVRVTRSLVLCVCLVDCCLSFWPLYCLFFFDSDYPSPYAGASGMLIHINENSDGKIEIISFVVKFHSSPVHIANSCV